MTKSVMNVFYKKRKMPKDSEETQMKHLFPSGALGKAIALNYKQ